LVAQNYLSDTQIYRNVDSAKAKVVKHKMVRFCGRKVKSWEKRARIQFPFIQTSNRTLTHTHLQQW
jgi:hypothetical protein